MTFHLNDWSWSHAFHPPVTSSNDQFACCLQKLTAQRNFAYFLFYMLQSNVGRTASGAHTAKAAATPPHRKVMLVLHLLDVPNLLHPLWYYVLSLSVYLAGLPPPQVEAHWGERFDSMSKNKLSRHAYTVQHQKELLVEPSKASSSYLAPLVFDVAVLISSRVVALILPMKVPRVSHPVQKFRSLTKYSTCWDINKYI